MKKICLLFLTFGFVIVLNGQEKHIITSDGVDLYVNVKGRGTPCLFSTGVPMYMQHQLTPLFQYTNECQPLYLYPVRKG